MKILPIIEKAICQSQVSCRYIRFHIVSKCTFVTDYNCGCRSANTCMLFYQAKLVLCRFVTTKFLPLVGYAGKSNATLTRVDCILPYIDHTVIESTREGLEGKFILQNVVRDVYWRVILTVRESEILDFPQNTFHSCFAMLTHISWCSQIHSIGLIDEIRTPMLWCSGRWPPCFLRVFLIMWRKESS
jgi:hypothetical protein